MSDPDPPSTNASLSEYETAGHPTSIDDIDAFTDPPLAETVRNLDVWHDAVALNDPEQLYLVGRAADQGATSYYLYHPPAFHNGQALAGVLIVGRTFEPDTTDGGGTTRYTLGFAPAGETPDDETGIERVTDIEVHPQPRTTALDTVLPRLRTAVTDSDWTGDGRADTAYGEWIDAMNTLVDYRREAYPDDAPMALPVQLLNTARVMHAVARYPLDAEAFLSTVALGIERCLDDGRHAANPFAVRRLLLDYTAQHVDIEDLDVTLTASDSGADP